MTDRLRQLRSAILAKLPDSDLTPLSAEELARVVERYQDLPEHLCELYTVVGVGSVGRSRYMIHGTLEPEEVYDLETATDLAGVVLVGDDFAGTCEAYDTRRGWVFGSVGASGEFGENGHKDFVSFLEDWYGDGATG